MKNYGLISVVAVLFTLGCKAPDIIRKEQDTLIVTERVEVIDTLLMRDTITVTKDRFSVRIIRLPGDSILVDGHCDTIKITVPQIVQIHNTKKLERQTKWTGSLFIVCIALIIVILLKR
jgi:hypothetical protein